MLQAPDVLCAWTQGDISGVDEETPAADRNSNYRGVPSQGSLLAEYLAKVLCGAGWMLHFHQRPAYVLVIDGGSSGTRIHAFQWRENAHKLPTLTAVSIQAARHKIPRRAAGDKRAYERLETEPGLDKFVGDAKGLESRALRPLLEWAEAVVPRRQWQRTPLFLFGTAGMRKLPSKGREVLLEDLRGALSKSSFRFEPTYATIISGEEEGLYGWIAVNYLNGHLLPAAPPTPVVVQGKPAAARHEAASEAAAATVGNAADLGIETVGILDLGGSSLEVTFMPTANPAVEATTNVTIMGINYPLYAHVHHGYGLNDAFDRSVTILIESMAPAQSLSSQKPPNASSTSSVKRIPDASAGSRDAPETSSRSMADQPLKGNQAAAVLQSRLQPSQEEGSGPASPRGLLDADADGALPFPDGASDAARKRSTLRSTPDRNATGQLNDVKAEEGFNHDAGSVRRRLAEPFVVEHPCLHKGYSAPYRRTPTHEGTLPKPALVQLDGSRPDYEACAALARQVLNMSDCGAANCVLGTAQPTSSRDFFGLAGFYVVFHFLGLSPSASLSDLEKEGRKHCAVNWQRLHEARGAEIHVDQYCFRVPYVVSLLKDGLAVPESKLHIGSGKEGWTLGAALAEGGRVGVGRSYIGKAQVGPWRAAAYLGVTVGTLSLLLLVWIFISRVLNGPDYIRRRSLSAESSPDVLSEAAQPSKAPVTGFWANVNMQKAPVPPANDPRHGSSLPCPLQSGTFSQQHAVQLPNYYGNLSGKSSRKRQPSVDNLRALGK